MESRKRPHETEAPIQVKKRALTSANDSPVTAVSPNPAADEPQPDEELENFRKEAIFRRMQHYSRQVERSQQRIDELQARTLSYEAALAAIETCWDQLLQQTQLLVQSDQITIDLEEPELLQLTRTNVPDGQIGKAYSDALSSREAHIIKVLKAILALPPRSTAPDSVDLQRTCQKLLSEVNGTKGELKLTRKRLEESTSIAERYLEQLAVAENRVERLKSETVQKVESKTRKGAVEEPKKEEPSEQNGSHVVKHEPMEISAPLPNGHVDSLEEAAWQEKAEQRAKLVLELQEQVTLLKRSLSAAQAKVNAPDPAMLRSLALYKHLENAAEKWKKANDEAREEAAALRDYVGQLNAERTDFQARMQAETNVKVTELKNMLEKRDSDNTRLREQREALTAELHERKAREAEREGSLTQSKILANARGERVAMLVSENHRLKARLAAREGEESFYAFIMSNPQDESYVRAQDERLELLQRSKEALDATLKSISATNSDVAAALKSETDARIACSELQQRLQKLEAIYGAEALATAAPGIQALSAELRKKEEELQRLRLELKAASEEPAVLYVEVERLSGLWENLDKQLKSKIFDLIAMEEKLARAATEKAKADNKYFATMRELEQVKGAKQALHRENQKQSAIIEKLAETEKASKEWKIHFEKENALQAKILSERDSVIVEVRNETDRQRAAVEHSNKRVSELQRQIEERDSLLVKRQLEVQKMSEECIDLRHATDDKIAKHRAANATGELATVIKERDQLMTILKCSTCKQQMRDRILVKCMHTFCKDCIDARLSTRQRKCPHCGLPFGNSDVQQLFLQ